MPYVLAYMMTISLAAVAFGLCRLFLWPQGPQLKET